MTDAPHVDVPTPEALRTPDDRFADLPAWPHPPTYLDDLPGFEGLRAHYVDLGPRDAEHTWLLLHGEPTWAYLYRKMIPVLLESGARVVAPDFFGFGRSDKPVDDRWYSFDRHRDHLLRLLERLDLSRLTLVVQDWGGLLGLTLPVDPGFAARLSRLVVMNTTLAVGESPGEGFETWRAYVAKNPDLAVGTLMRRSEPLVTEADAAAYDAPFPDGAFKAGVRSFPQLVMTSPGMAGVDTSRAAAQFWSTFTGPSFMAVGAKDPVLGVEVMARLRATIHGCPEPLVLDDAGHFVQEHGDVIARAALASFAG